MRDPREGLSSDGMITTGVDRALVPAAFEPLLAEVIMDFEAVALPDAELHLYGSVATGCAVVGRSDVDLLVIDGPDGWAADAGARLSVMFSELCRSVEIGAGHAGDFAGADDESYGNQVFLRHYCTWLAGANRRVRREAYAGDARAARGFNGDIGRQADRWRSEGASLRRVGRKSLLAASSLISVRDSTWTTDRGMAAQRWAEMEPRRRSEIERLLAWGEDSAETIDDSVRDALEPGGIVSTLVEQFGAEVGLWVGNAR